jgi:hypothetical protein
MYFKNKISMIQKIRAVLAAKLELSKKNPLKVIIEDTNRFDIHKL